MKRGRTKGLVVVCFIVSAGLLHGNNTGPNVPEKPAENSFCSSAHFFTVVFLIIFVICSQSILSDQFLCIFSKKLITFLRLISMKSIFHGSLMLNKVNLMFLSMSQCAHHSPSVQSCSWTAQVAVGQGQDGPLLCSLLLLPRADPGAVFTLLITGEGPADRRAITDSPQARGWERYKNPLPSPKCDGNVQLSQGSLHWQNPRVQREILKT